MNIFNICVYILFWCAYYVIVGPNNVAIWEAYLANSRKLMLDFDINV